MEFNSFEAWGEKRNVVALHNLISEFNARQGLDLDLYLEHSRRMGIGKTQLGQEEWLKIKPLMPEIETFLSQSNQPIRYQRFNWPVDGLVHSQAATILNTPMGDHLGREHVEYTAYAIAQAIQEPMLIFETPGFGKSALTKEQKSALNKSNFDPVASAMLDALKALEVTSINCVGYSLGAEVAAAIAANAEQFGINVHNLLIVESSRVVRQNAVSLLINFIREKPNLLFAWSHPADPILRSITSLKGEKPQGFNYSRALHKGGIIKSVRRSLESQPNMCFTLCSGDTGKVSPIDANTRLYREMKDNFVDHVIRQIIMPGETHAFAASVSRYAHITKLVLKNSLNGT